VVESLTFRPVNAIFVVLEYNENCDSIRDAYDETI
jgi:hypothetical protein